MGAVCSKQSAYLGVQSHEPNLVILPRLKHCDLSYTHAGTETGDISPLVTATAHVALQDPARDCSIKALLHTSGMARTWNQWGEEEDILTSLSP
jgi:hypothetical protein